MPRLIPTLVALAIATAFAQSARAAPEGSDRSPVQGAPSQAEPPAATRFRLVVASFEEQGVPPGMGDVVADMIIRAIDAPHIELLERRQVKRVLDEQSFAASDLTEPGEAMRYGRLVDSRYVLVGSVYRLDGNYIVSARMVDAGSGVIPQRGRAVQQFRTVDEMASRIIMLVSALGLCDACGPADARSATSADATPAPAASADPPSLPGNAAAPPTADPATVSDMLERIGGQRGARVEISLPNPRRTLAVGEELSLRIASEQDGYLSLFVVDAQGSVSMLLPNQVAREFPITAAVPVDVPKEAGFRLRIRPPLGTTRVKALVTERPLPLAGTSGADGLLRSVQLSDVLVTPRADGTSQGLGQWSSSELEFLVVPSDAQSRGEPEKPDVSAPPSAPRVPSRAAVSAKDAALVALGKIREGSPEDQESAAQVLRWPLESPFVPKVDLSARPVGAPVAAAAPLIAVIDADFDPDDPLLADAFSHIDPARLQSLRAEMRRNGDPVYRHGNRVASIIAGRAPWLPSVIPGARIFPVRVTSQADGPEYRVRRGDAEEIVRGLREAMSAGCRVINLSLSVRGDDESLAALLGDPVWDELEKRGVLVVCAAGNSGADLDRHPSYPACIDRPNILCVGAVGPDGGIARWDGAGSCVGQNSVDVMAPGELIAVSDGTGSVALANGTSYACAFATGVAALMMAENPQAPAAAIADAIRAAARPHPALATLCRAGILSFPAVRSREIAP